MSFLSFFETLFAKAESAFMAIEPAIAPVVNVARELAPVAEALVPSAAPIIHMVAQGVGAASALAPTAVADASALVTAGRQAVTDLGPALLALEQSLSGLFHITATPQAIVLTPKTTAATVATPPVAPVDPAAVAPAASPIAAPPGNALS